LKPMFKQRLAANSKALMITDIGYEYSYITLNVKDVQKSA